MQTGSGLAGGTERNAAFYRALRRKGLKGRQGADTDACDVSGARSKDYEF